MVDITTRTGPIEHMIQIYEINEDPIVPSTPHPDTRSWRTNNDIKIQIKQQVHTNNLKKEPKAYQQRSNNSKINNSKKSQVRLSAIVHYKIGSFGKQKRSYR